MKFSLFTSIGVAIVGVLLSFLITNLITPELQPYEVKVISDSQNFPTNDDYDYASLAQPDNEVFNYEALNPTVEVYVGDCQAVDANGNCLEDTVVVDESAEEESTENSEENLNSENDGQENG